MFFLGFHSSIYLTSIWFRSFIYALQPLVERDFVIVDCMPSNLSLVHIGMDHLAGYLIFRKEDAALLE